MANRFQWKITADDETEKGVKSAEKRMGGLTKATNRYGEAAKKASKDGPGKKSGFVQVKSAMDQVAKATDRVASAAPGLNRYTSVLKDVHGAASDAAKGVNEAAKAGSGLGGMLSGIAATGGGVVGVLAAVTAGAVKLASGWAEGGAQLGRLSASLGVSTDDLQKFQAVGEQFGVDKDTTTAGVGGIASTLHEAKYGRNNEALAAMNQLGITPKYGANGQPDVTDFTKQLSDAIVRQKDPMTQARIASIFGAGGMLTMLRQGSGAIGSRMTAAGKYAAVMDSSGITDASRIWEKGVLGKQLAGRAGMQIDASAARAGEGALDAGLSAGRAAADGGGVSSMASGVVNAGVSALGGASKWAAGEVAQFGGAVSAAMGRLEKAAQQGQAKTGVPALVTVAQADLESGHLKHMPAGSNNPFGIKAQPGEPFVEAMTSEQDQAGHVRRTLARFRKFDSLEDAVAAHDELLAHGRPYAAARGAMGDPYAYAASIAPHYATDKQYDAKLEREMHEVEVHVYDHRTTAKVKHKGRDTAVAVGHTMAGSGP